MERLEFTIRRMSLADVEGITRAFARRNKQREQYVRYFDEHGAGKRVTLVALRGEEVIGYGNVLWESGYSGLRESGIPEINDLNVVEEFQNRGVGRALIREAERIAAERGVRVMGIGVGLTPDYAAAQHLYPKLGYVPDGRGIHPTQYGEVAYFIKRLDGASFIERSDEASLP